MFCTISHGILRHTHTEKEWENLSIFPPPLSVSSLCTPSLFGTVVGTSTLWCISRAERVTYANSSIDSSNNADRMNERGEEKKTAARTNSFRWQLPSPAKRKTLYCDVRQRFHPTEWHRLERQRRRKRHETNVVQYFNSYREIPITNH